MAQRNTRERQMRERLAQEAAQILAETGSRDFFAAKRKAAEHLGAVDTRNMPSNKEIEVALMTYQRLFRADRQPQELRRLRQVALQAMKFFTRFRPRLAGSVLRGTADTNSTVTLHVYAGAVEEVGLHLMDNAIPFETADKRLRFGIERYQTLPVYRFLAEETPIEVVVFPMDGSHQAPLSPVDGKSMQRADIAAVEKLLAD
jgi:hypothetical protein